MKLMLVGGFLGAGKTTLLWEAAKLLSGQGRRVGLITNDQTPDLVDTGVLSALDAPVREVAGSCFCCNFDGFQEAVQSLVDDGAEYVLAEPVGSCTDLSATIIQPLKQYFPQYEVAPLTVLADPVRIREVFREASPRLHADGVYILHLQMEEADQILLNKADALNRAEREEHLAFLKEEFPEAQIGAISAMTGEGVAAWLTHTLRAGRSGTRIAHVDYDRYANGEAVLGWLNSVIGVEWIEAAAPDWPAYARGLLEHVRESLRSSRSQIGHIKMLLECSGGRLLANVTGLEVPIAIKHDGNMNARDAMITFNARAQTSPLDIEQVFRRSLVHASQGRVAPVIRTLHCIKPGRPQPQYRFDAVVE